MKLQLAIPSYYKYTANIISVHVYIKTCMLVQEESRAHFQHTINITVNM